METMLKMIFNYNLTPPWDQINILQEIVNDNISSI